MVNWRVVAWASTLYFAVLIALIAATVAYNIRVMHSAGSSEWAPLIRMFKYVVLQLAYYAAPFAVAALIGRRCRHFWANFGAIVVIIFGLHAVYTIATNSLFHTYFPKWRAEVTVDVTTRLGITNMDHHLDDTDGDGLIDKIVLAGKLDTSGLDLGKYTIVVQNFGPNQSYPILGRAEIAMMARGPNLVDFTINIDAYRMRDVVAPNGLAALYYSLGWHRPASSSGTTIFTLCSWAAFYCPTSTLKGDDPANYVDLVYVAHGVYIHMIKLETDLIQPNPVIFHRFLRDQRHDSMGVCPLSARPSCYDEV